MPKTQRQNPTAILLGRPCGHENWGHRERVNKGSSDVTFDLLRLASGIKRFASSPDIKKPPKGGFFMSGAGEENRTLVCSLGSCRSTIELHPPFETAI
jgi:hypothetical protein